MEASTETNKLDDKTTELAKLLYHLRQDIDLYWAIGRNVKGLKEVGVGNQFWVHVQNLALDSLVLTICKIFEHEKEYERNSVPGLLNIIPPLVSEEQWLHIKRFGTSYGYNGTESQANEFLRAVLKQFREHHKDSFEKFRWYRNKFGAHSEHGAERDTLPSIAEFDAFFDFADSFYRLVHDKLNNIGPALIGTHVHFSTLCVMEKLGIKNLDRSPSRLAHE